jgi:hypothetical protein
LNLLALLKSVKKWVSENTDNSWADKEAVMYLDFKEKIDEGNEE